MTDATDVALVPLTTRANRRQAAAIGRLAVQPHAAALDPRRGPRHAQRDARRGRPLQHAALPQPDGQRRGRGPRPRDRPARRGDRPGRPAAQGDRGRAPRPGPADEADVPEPGDRPGRGRGRDPDHADRLLPGPSAGRDGRGVGAGGPRRRRAGALGHADDPEHRVVHGGDHGRRRGGLERDHAGQLRRPPPPRGGDAGRPGGDHRGQGAAPPDHHDRAAP